VQVQVHSFCECDYVPPVKMAVRPSTFQHMLNITCLIHHYHNPSANSLTQRTLEVLN